MDHVQKYIFKDVKTINVCCFGDKQICAPFTFIFC